MTDLLKPAGANVVIHTERLALRAFCEEDVVDVLEYTYDLENLRYMLFEPNDGAGAASFVKGAMERSATRPDCDFAVTMKGSGEVVGGCSICINGTESQEASIGWLLRADCHNRGYGTETAKALIRYGFESLGVRRITAFCHAENVSSYRIMEKAGMRREGKFIKARRWNSYGGNEWTDELAYAILRDEWANGVNAVTSHIDTVQGLRRFDDDEKAYYRVLSDFKRVHANDGTQILNGANAVQTAHTLKSSAATIGALRLSELAKEAERAIKTGEQFNVVALEYELYAVMSDIDQVIDAMSPRVITSAKKAAVVADNRRVAALAAELEPLLAGFSFDCLKYTDEIEAVFACVGDRGKKLAELVGDFEFVAAKKLLSEIMSELG